MIARAVHGLRGPCISRTPCISRRGAWRGGSIAGILGIMGGLAKVHDILRLLSVDVAVAALGGGVLAGHVMRVRMPWAWYIVLPAAVWCVYTLDHLFDARRVGPGASTPRHRFHHRHFRPLALACGIAAIVTLLLALAQLQPKGVWFGVALAAGVLLHLGLIELVGGRASPLLMKELGVALIFTAGAWGLPAVHHRLILLASTWLLMGQYALLVMVNLIEFSWYEVHLDTIDGHTSFVRGIGPQRAPMVVGVLLAAVVMLGVMAVMLRPGPRVMLAEAIYAGMAIVLGLIMLRPTWFGRHERYRLWGDGAFLLPWLVVLQW